MKITIKNTKQDGGNLLYAGNKLVGTITANPNDLKAMNSGRWSASVYTSDYGLWRLGANFSTQEQALQTALSALENNLTYAQCTKLSDHLLEIYHADPN